MAGGIFSYGMPTLSCSKWDLAPFLAIESSSSALGTQGLSHQTTREVPGLLFLI